MVYDGTKNRNICCQRPNPILPAVFDNIMSYEEQIAVLCQHFNDLQDYTVQEIEGIKKNLVTLVDERFNTLAIDLRKQMGILSDSFNSLAEEFEELKTGNSEWQSSIEKIIDANREEIYQYVNNRLDKFKSEYQTEFNALASDLHLQINALRKFTVANTESEVGALKEYVDNKNAALWDAVNSITTGKTMVTNWFRLNETTPLQVLLDDMWRYMRGCALDTREYDELGLTADNIDDSELPAYQHDTQSWRRYYFDKVYKPQVDDKISGSVKMRNPYTGELSTVQDVAQYIFECINFNGKTAEEYDTLGIDAQEFDTSDYDAFTQDTHKTWRSTDTDMVDEYLPFAKTVWTAADSYYVELKVVLPDFNTFDYLIIDLGYGTKNMIQIPDTVKNGENIITAYVSQINNKNGIKTDVWYRECNIGEQIAPDDTIKPMIYFYNGKSVSGDASGNMCLPRKIYTVAYNDLVSKKESGQNGGNN